MFWTEAPKYCLHFNWIPLKGYNYGRYGVFKLSENIMDSGIFGMKLTFLCFYEN